MSTDSCVRTLELSSRKHSHSPKTCRQSTANQKIPGPALQDPHSKLCCGIRVGIVTLGRGLVDGMISTILCELLVHELTTTITMNPEDQRMRQAAVIVVDLC